MSNQIKHRKLGTEPLVGLYYVAECIKCGWIGSSGELTEDDAQCLQPVGDDHCWGDTDEIDAERLLELLQAGAFDKPIAQPQGKPVPVMKLEAERLLGTDGEYSVSFVKAGWIDECRKTGGVFYLYAEQPAQAAVVMPEFESAFEAWWESDGQYCRAGGGSYEKTFAYRAYEAALAEVTRLNTPQ